MADFFDTFDGPADQAIEDRTGWSLKRGSLSFARTTGTGALKTIATAENDGTGSASAFVGPGSQWAQVTLGDYNPAANAVALLFVKGRTAGNINSCVRVNYHPGYGEYMVYASTSILGKYATPCVPGTVLRLEAEDLPDKSGTYISLLVDGVRRIGPVLGAAELAVEGGPANGPYIGVCPRALSPTEMIRDIAGGLIVPDTTRPTHTGALTVTGKTYNTITAQCPVASDNVAVTAYEWSKDGGTTWVTGTRDQTFTSLTASTSYPLRARAKDAAGNVSTPDLALSVTTDAPPPPDTTKPVISGVSATAVNASTASGSVTSNEAGTGYAVMTRTATALTAAQVKSTGTVLVRASAPVAVGANPGVFNLTGLDPETTAYMQVAVEDESGNISQVSVSAAVTQPAGLPEGWLVDDFIGPSGAPLTGRGWTASNANTSFAELNGNGGVRSKNTDQAGNPAFFSKDTGSTSHFAEAVVGSTPTGIAFVAVKLDNAGTAGSEGVYVDYAAHYNSLFLRDMAGGVMGSAGHALAQGDVLRLEAKMTLDNLAYDVTLYVNGQRRIPAVRRTRGLSNRGSGFRVISPAPAEDTLQKFTAGRLVLPPPDTVAPVFTMPVGTATGAYSAVGSVSCTELSFSWAALTTSATKPTALQLKENTGAFVARHTGAADIGENTDQYLFVGLQPSTTYYMHVAGQDLTGNLSNVVTSAPFTTQHLGVLGSVILATTGGGAAGAGFLYDKVGPGDGDKYFHYVITRQPTLGTLDAYPDGSFSYSGDTDSFEYSLYKNGVFVAAYTVALNLGTVAADTTPPVLTGAIEVVSKSDTSVSLRCPVGTDNVGVTGYEWSRDGGSTWTLGGRDFTFSGLTASTAYGFRVRAKDAADNKSAPALTISVTTEAPPVATVMHCRMAISANGLPSAVGLSGIAWAFWNSPTPVIGSAADYMGTGLTVVDQDGQGMVNIPLPNTPLRTGEVGVVELVINDGTPTGANNRALKKAVAVGP